MAALLKDVFNKKTIILLASEIKKQYRSFENEAFIGIVFDQNWKERELKQRIRHISECLTTFLPEQYEKALEILKPVSLEISLQCNDLVHLVFPDFVELCGLTDYKNSVSAMAFFTSGSSSEFPVRHFIIKYEKKMMAQMYKWACSDDEHLRRLASEGCRPRLPWAIGLPKFKNDPTPILPILEKLKNDKSEYVRRSVANNLNDISKDNPKIVIKLAKAWLGQCTETDKLVKHGCRTLLKQGEADVLKLFGFRTPGDIKLKKLKLTKEIEMGDEIEFEFFLQTTKKKLGKLRIEYIVEFARQNNKTGKKVFKISEGEYAESERYLTKKHSFKPISTRKYYSGKHSVSIVVNGIVLSTKSFMIKDN